MPPEVYDGPVWLEVLGGTAALIMVVLVVIYARFAVDRIAERRFNAELEGEDARREFYRSASRLNVTELADDSVIETSPDIQHLASYHNGVRIPTREEASRGR